MRSLSPVVWREGMHLSQHHFQLRDRYFESSAAFALDNLFFKPYGLTGLELDHDALLNGTVSVIHARGVMPDGLTFAFPDDACPAPIEIRDRFSPTQESHLVLLAIPPYRSGRSNCALDPDTDVAGQSSRWVAETTPRPDETTGEDEQTVTVGRKNFSLVLDDEDSGELVTLPLARVKRDRSGQFVYDPTFIPPCIQIAAGSRILEIVRRAIEVMEAKAESLARDRTAAGPGSRFAADEIASFWLSHAIHSSMAPLRHHLQARTTHPEEVFSELLRLAGALCTFSITSHPRDLPLYDHDNLEECFSALDQHIRTHLDVVLPKKAVRILLDPMEEYYFTGAVSDRRCFRDAHWFLEVEVSEGRETVIADVPRLIKVCSTEHISRLVQAAYPGMELQHVASPPAAASPRIGAEYFRIETAGPCWVTTEQTRNVAIYAPGDLSNLRFEIVVIPEEQA
jgi:type VI secretion system protein ImpJ